MRIQVVLVCISIGFLLVIAPNHAVATSAQIETSEPVLTPATEQVHGTAFFGALSGGDLYNTAGSLGVTFVEGKEQGAAMYFFADIFTWVETDDAQFSPQRVAYTIEPGVTWATSRGRCRFFVKHQSFHNVDVDNDTKESYELYGLSYRFNGRPELYLSVGTYQNRQIVDYSLDIAASATQDIGQWGKHRLYGHLWMHEVTENGNPTGRSGFTDWAVETGMAYRSGLSLFLRYEQLHDIDRFNGLTDTHLMIGAKYVR